jgi:hypothetical protein
MVKGANGHLVCSKHFPKEFSEETQVLENGYPQYRRTMNIDISSHYTIPNPLQRGARFHIDNRWIVPYNPYLSKKFKAHINVECCQGVQAIKYINKYVYKGADRTTMRLSDTDDEIERYLQGRYIGPTEAFWRIFEYRMHEEYPTVTSLSLHLKDQQPVYFPDDAADEEVQQILNKSRSMLMAYFDYYKGNPNKPKYLYQDFPCHFVWKQKKNAGNPVNVELLLEEFLTALLHVGRDFT